VQDNQIPAKNSHYKQNTQLFNCGNNASKSAQSSHYIKKEKLGKRPAPLNTIQAIVLIPAITD